MMPGETSFAWGGAEDGGGELEEGGGQPGGGEGEEVALVGVEVGYGWRLVSHSSIRSRYSGT